MNVRLDRLVHRLVHEPGLRARAEADAVTVGGEAGVAADELAAALRTDLVALHDRGVHPLLLMHLAGAAKVDAMALLVAPAGGATGGLTVLLDVAKCEGFASCVLSAPEVFDLDEQAGVAVLLVEAPPETMRADVEEAARSCPVRAITVAG